MDLEETVIQQWGNWELIEDQCTFIFKNTLETDEIWMFSWAIWNDSDKELFHKRLRHPLENTLGRKITNVPSILDFMTWIRNCSHLKKMTQEDFFDFFIRKEQALAFLAMHGVFQDKHIILFDDTVTNARMEFADYRTTIQTVNILDPKLV